jgi:hypothetical protein
MVPLERRSNGLTRKVAARVMENIRFFQSWSRQDQKFLRAQRITPWRDTLVRPIYFAPTLVSRFQSWHDQSARSDANFGI